MWKKKTRQPISNLFISNVDYLFWVFIFYRRSYIYIKHESSVTCFKIVISYWSIKNKMVNYQKKIVCLHQPTLRTSCQKTRIQWSNTNWVSTQIFSSCIATKIVECESLFIKGQCKWGIIVFTDDYWFEVSVCHLTVVLILYA